MLVLVLSMAMIITLVTATAITLHNEAERSRIHATARKTRVFDHPQRY